MRWRVRLLFSLVLLVALPAGADCRLRPEPLSLPPAGPGEVAIASLNLWRLADTEKDARYDRPVSAQRLDGRLEALARHIDETLSRPALLAVQEVENLALLEGLARRLNARAGTDYRALLREGNDPSGIDVGVLFRQPVAIGSVSQLFADLRAPGGYPLFSRPPLHLVLSAPFVADLVVVHLRSGRDLEETEVRARRRLQAQRLRQWLLARHRAGRAVLLAGDLNSAGEDVYGEPAAILSRPPLHSVWQRLKEEHRFSYIHDCRGQPIDNILYNRAVAERVRAAAVSRGEAGHFDALYGSGGTGEVVTDHDTPVLYLKAKGPPPEEAEAR